MSCFFKLFVFFGLFFIAGCQPRDKKFTIGYVQINEDPVLNVARSAVFRAIADSGFVNGLNINIIENNAQGDLSMINAILQSLLSQSVDMIITNSTPCMVAAAHSVQHIPVVFTVAFGPEQMGMKTVPENLNGIFDPLDAGPFVDLLQECIPGLTRIGIPFNNAEPNAEYSVKMLTLKFTERGISVVTAPVNSTNDILQAGEFLAGQHIDAYVTGADNTLFLCMPMLAKLARERKIPLFATDPMQVDKGAAVGLGADYDRWGYLSGLKAVEILRGRAPSGARIEPLLKPGMSVNLKACADQGLTIPVAVIGRAGRIIR